MMTAGCQRTTRRWLAALVAGLLFVSQIAGAAQACMLAMAGTQVSSAQMSNEGCDGTPMDSAVCRLNCLAPDQNTVSPDQPLHAVASVAPAQHVVIAPIAVAFSPQWWSAARLPGGPPLRILHCSYQT